MTLALDYMFYNFNKWLVYVFTDMSFTYAGYNVTFGWLIVAISVISMLIATILNIPHKLPSDAFYTEKGRYSRDFTKAVYRQDVSSYAYRYRRSK